MLQPFALEEPTSVREASALLARYGEAARLYAGGTELLLVMKEGLLHYESTSRRFPGLPMSRWRSVPCALAPPRRIARSNARLKCARTSRLWRTWKPTWPTFASAARGP